MAPGGSCFIVRDVVSVGLGWCASGDLYYDDDEEGYLMEKMQHLPLIYSVLFNIQVGTMNVHMASIATHLLCFGITIPGAYCAGIGSLVKRFIFQTPQDRPKVELVFLVTYDLHFVNDN